MTKTQIKDHNGCPYCGGKWVTLTGPNKYKCRDCGEQFPLTAMARIKTTLPRGDERWKSRLINPGGAVL